MAEERTLGLARARETVNTVDDQPSKEELQRRMEEARDSITNTVTEIKDNVAQQYENVKEALDWREHFKRQPVAWSLGAAGVGFFVGYGIAAAISGDDEEEIHTLHHALIRYRSRQSATSLATLLQGNRASLRRKRTARMRGRVCSKDFGKHLPMTD